MEFIDQVRARQMTTHDLANWLLARPDCLIADSSGEGANPSEAWSAPMDLTDVPYDWPEHTDAIQICVLDNGGPNSKSPEWNEGYVLGAKTPHANVLDKLANSDFAEGWEQGTQFPINPTGDQNRSRGAKLAEPVDSGTNPKPPAVLVDLTIHLAEQIDSRLEDPTTGDPDDKKPLWTMRDHLTPEYVRNFDSWVSDVDFTCHSVWNSWSAGNRRTGTLIAPDAYIASWHYKNPVGYTYRFVEDDGTVHTRTKVAQTQIGKSDLYVGKFDSDLPSSITHAKIPPANLPDYFTGTLRAAAAGLDQEDHVTCRDLTTLSSFNVAFSTPTDPTRLTYYELLIDGDSGDPGFLIIDGEIVLLTTWTGGGGGSGGPIHSQLTAINAALVSMGSAYSADVVDLSGFIDYS